MSTASDGERHHRLKGAEIVFADTPSALENTSNRATSVYGDYDAPQ